MYEISGAVALHLKLLPKKGHGKKIIEGRDDLGQEMSPKGTCGR